MIKYYSHSLFILFLLCIAYLPFYASAQDISIQLTQISVDNHVTIKLTNQSSQAIQISRIRLILNKQIYWLNNASKIEAHQTKHFKFIIDYPKLAGSYAQYASIFYLNEGKEFSLNDVGYFNYQAQKQLSINAQLSNKYVNNQAIVRLEASKPLQWNLFFPDELIVDLKTIDSAQQAKLSRKYSGFNNNYPIFAILERQDGQYHYSQIIRSSVMIKDRQNTAYQRGKTNNIILIAFMLLSLISFIILIKTIKASSRWHDFLLLFVSRLFFISSSYFLLKNITTWTEFSPLLNQHFSGKNYRYFFEYFIDAYFWSFIILYIPYLIIFDKARSIKDDKYIAALYSLLKFFIAKHLIKSTTKLLKPSVKLIQSPTKSGWLILAVKLFFLPLIASWVIGNIIHQGNLFNNFQWDFYKINAFILALLILIDTGIFLIGYMFENERLGSKVRSVEPSIFGWLVCLWCYPPFNSFSFAPFDIALFPIHIPIDTWAKPIVLSLITFLWAIFVWASISMGLKASNLTNRGIIKKGPYRYCRHPAYTAKIMVWFVEAIFLGQYFVGLFISFLIIYFLRAITEEQHLSKDPDYIQYKKEVKYRFIPGLI